MPRGTPGADGAEPRGHRMAVPRIPEFELAPGYRPRDHVAVGDVHPAARCPYGSSRPPKECHATVDAAKAERVRCGSAHAELRHHRHSAADLSAVPRGAAGRADRARSHRAGGAVLRYGAHRTARPTVRRPAGHPPVRTRHHVGAVVGQGDPQHPEHGGRGAPPVAQPGLEGVHAARDRTHARRDPHRGQRAPRQRPGRRALRVRRRRRPALSDPGHLRAVRRARARTGSSSPGGPRTSSRSSASTATSPPRSRSS